MAGEVAEEAREQVMGSHFDQKVVQEQLLQQFDLQEILVMEIRRQVVVVDMEEVEDSACNLVDKGLMGVS